MQAVAAGPERQGRFYLQLRGSPRVVRPTQDFSSRLLSPLRPLALPDAPALAKPDVRVRSFPVLPLPGLTFLSPPPFHAGTDHKSDQISGSDQGEVGRGWIGCAGGATGAGRSDLHTRADGCEHARHERDRVHPPHPVREPVSTMEQITFMDTHLPHVVLISAIA